MAFNCLKNALQTAQSHIPPTASQLSSVNSASITKLHLHGLNCLFDEMKTEKVFSNRLTQASFFSSFILGGLNSSSYQSSVVSIISLLSGWVRELKYELKASYSEERLSEIEQLMSIILSICQHCPLNNSELKSTNIGKSLNKFSKNLPESSAIKAGCRDLVAKWRKLYEESASALATSGDFAALGKKRERENGESSIEKPSDTKDKGDLKDLNHSTKALEKRDQLKSCLQKQKGQKAKKRPVKFASDAITNQMRIFKPTDEPNALPMSNEDYLKIQQELPQNSLKFKVSNDKRKEDIRMDKPIKCKPPMTQWRHPQKLSFSSIKTLPNSKESKAIDDYCAQKLSVTYFNSIPDPREGKCVLFPYEDQSIPKIDNGKEAFDCSGRNADPIAEVVNYIDSLKGKEFQLEEVQGVFNILKEVNTIEEQQKQRIINALCAKLSQKSLANIINHNSMRKNQHQCDPGSEDSRRSCGSRYSIPKENINSNATNDSNNSTDSVDNQDKRCTGDVSGHFNDIFESMFNDIIKPPYPIQEKFNLLHYPNINYPFPPSFIPNQPMQTPLFPYYPINPLMNSLNSAQNIKTPPQGASQPFHSFSLSPA